MVDPVFTVGDVLRKLRKDKRWSIRKLAAESGVGRMTISDIERNQSNYQKETLEALATVFGKTGAELEAMVMAPPPRLRRVGDYDLAPEWVAFTRRVMRLTRLAQGAMNMTLLAFEDAGAIQRGFTHPPAESTAVDPDTPNAP